MKYKELNRRQKKRLLISFCTYVLLGVLFLAHCSIVLYSNKISDENTWQAHLQDSPEQRKIAEELSKDAISVTVGTYIENLRELNIKDSYYRVEFEVWFRWEGDPALDPANHMRIYKGLINQKSIMKEIHSDGVNYQLVSVDVSVSKSFSTKTFPLDLHQLHLYVESTYPIETVVFEADRANSGINRNLSLTGYEFLKHDVGAVSYIYDGTHGDPEIEGNIITSELVTAFEINRSGFGLYMKCFIALVGTITWSLIALYICTYHHVDPLGMIPGALFGTVGNIMVGASLLPDALEMGLLEYVNVMGIVTILGAAAIIININRIRSKYQDKQFAHYYGTVMFYVVLTFTVIGQILLPVLAYHY